MLYKKYLERNNNIINNNSSQKEKNKINNIDSTNINLITDENLMNSLNTDKYKLSMDGNDIIKFSSVIKFILVLSIL